MVRLGIYYQVLGTLGVRASKLPTNHTILALCGSQMDVGMTRYIDYKILAQIYGCALRYMVNAFNRRFGHLEVSFEQSKIKRYVLQEGRTIWFLRGLPYDFRGNTVQEGTG
ncbi:hypothetical protein TNIN_479001 [Trichonephila inaurata madagascariensis]|uniref:Uncharacterized protein n=1 Tax=Trichonephila inaurata madagascariensis TaxID=2747483 RepID=A0A8X7BZZ3_9ARAC|nr:hypothetical protein TNIN_479001 [Trichonephila inaurata madagascariensis]